MGSWLEAGTGHWCASSDISNLERHCLLRSCRHFQGEDWGRWALSAAVGETSDLIAQIHARVVAVAWSWELGLGLNAKSVPC